MTTSPTEKTFASGTQSGAAQRSTSQAEVRIGHRGRCSHASRVRPRGVHRARGAPASCRRSRGSRRGSGHPERDDRDAGDAPVEQRPRRSGAPYEASQSTVARPRPVLHGRNAERKRDDLERDRDEEEPGRAEPELRQIADAPAEGEPEREREQTGKASDHEALSRPAPERDDLREPAPATAGALEVRLERGDDRRVELDPACRRSSSSASSGVAPRGSCGRS